MAKQLVEKTESGVLTFEERLTVSGLSDQTIKLINQHYSEEKNLANAIDLMSMCMSSLSFKEASLILKHRNSRSVNVSLRMSSKEVDLLDDVETALRTRGYINSGRTDAIMFMIANFDLPIDKQQVIEM